MLSLNYLPKYILDILENAIGLDYVNKITMHAADIVILPETQEG